MANTPGDTKSQATGPHRFHMDGWISCAPIERPLNITIAFIHLDDLYKPARMDALAKAEYHYQLWRIHPDTGEPQVFARSGDFSIEHSFSTSFEIPNGRWTLSIMPMQGLHSPLRLAVGLLLALLFAALTAFLSWSWLRQPVSLKEEVEARTRELTAANSGISRRLCSASRSKRRSRRAMRRWSNA